MIAPGMGAGVAPCAGLHDATTPFRPAPIIRRDPSVGRRNFPLAVKLWLPTVNCPLQLSLSGRPQAPYGPSL